MHTRLHEAIGRGNPEEVRALLDAGGIDVNLENAPGVPPLFAAAQQGHLEIVKRLLEVDGINVNKAGPDGRTPLFAAAQQGHLEIVERLLEVDGVDVHKDCPLYIAAQQGHPEIVTRLLEKGANYHEAQARAAIEDPSSQLCLKQGWHAFLSKELAEDPEFKELLDLVDLYRCPITLAPISNPKLLSSGITVDASAWNEWVDAQEFPAVLRCPLTNQEVDEITYDNLLAKKMYEKIWGIIEKLNIEKNVQTPSMFSQTKRAILEQLDQIRCPMYHEIAESTTVPNILVKQMNEKIQQLLGNAPRSAAGAMRSPSS